jgi:glycosyltransferase involved in cell wall biosynthesis
VLLPAANIGRIVKDQEEAIVLQQGNALEIAQKLESLFPDRELRRKIGEAGYHFAESKLRWSHSAEILLKFYHRLLNT